LNSRDALRYSEAEAVADNADSGSATDASGLDRRTGSERRQRTLYSIFHGGFRPRRRGARRTGAPVLHDLDWHPPQWLAVGILIVILSCIDAALTLTLIDKGAYEVNPFMAGLVGGSAEVFTLVKIGLTAGGVVLLTLLARMRAFGRIPVALMLYGVLGGYGTLVLYELHLLGETLLTP